MEELWDGTEPTPCGPSFMDSGMDSEDRCADSGYSKRRINNVLDEIVFIPTTEGRGLVFHPIKVWL